MPGSFSLPFGQFVQPHECSNTEILKSHPSYPHKSYTTLRTPDEIIEQLKQSMGAQYANQVLNGQRSIVATCGSGMTAAVLWLGISSVWESQNKNFTMGIYDEVKFAIMAIDIYAHASISCSLGPATLHEQKVKSSRARND
jgi:thiosulfate/3-mercaptopyruvate sulfurtransferase